MIDESNILKENTKLYSDNGEYTIVKFLGSGSFGITYKAKSKISSGNINHTVYYAVKEFFMPGLCHRDEHGNVCVNKAQQALYDSQHKAFRKEAEMLRELPAHKGIVKVNECFDANGTSYYVMEFLETPLSEYVKSHNGGRLPEHEAIELFAKIADAVASLHACNRLHLDIKPDNIMLNDGNPCLIDFGQSRVFDKHGELANEADNACTDGYAPEEQYRGITSFAPSADIYALGATLFYMLTGEKPVAADKISESYIREHLPEGITEKVSNVIVRCMSASPLARYQDISELTYSLNLQIDSNDEDGGTRLIDTTHSSGSGTTKMAKILAIVAVACVAIYGVILAVGMFTSDPAKPEQGEQTPARTEAPDSTSKTTDVKESASGTANKASSKSEEELVGKKANKVAGSTSTQEHKASAPAMPDLGYATWSGKMKNGKPEGNGLMRFKQRHVIPGTDIMANPGDKFIGAFHKGKMVNGNLNGTYYEQED